MSNIRAPRILSILAASAVLHVIVSACSHGVDSVAMAGTGGTGGGTGTPATVGAGGASSGSAGSCMPCASEKFTTIVEPCKPADAMHNAPYALHEFPGVGANDLARVVAMATNDPPLYFDFPGATVVVLVKEGVVGAYCSNGAQTITFIAPKF